MKIVFYTQDQENYGAHTWDGEGECPQYWKFKFGDTTVVEVPGPDLANRAFRDALVAEVTEMLRVDTEAFRTYVLSWEIMDDSDVVGEDWESVTYLSKSALGEWTGFVTGPTYTDPRLTKVHSFTVANDGVRTYVAPTYYVTRTGASAEWSATQQEFVY